MAKLVWDKDGERFYETGIDHCALYVWDKIGTGSTAKYGYKNGVAWNGITSISETPEGGEANDIYADNIKYLTLMSNENLNVSIEAYTYPDQFMECDGTYQPVDGMRIHQQKRKKFGLAYRTRIGNDEDGDSHGYKIHVIYNCLASPSDTQYQSVNDSPEAITFSWEASTTPIEVGTINQVAYKPTSRIVIDSRDFTDDDTKKTYLAKLEAYLFGQDEVTGQTSVDDIPPTLLTPEEIYGILSSGTDPS